MLGNNDELLGYSANYVELIDGVVEPLRVKPKVFLSFNKFSRECKGHVMDEFTKHCFCIYSGENCRKDRCEDYAYKYGGVQP